ncbi:hypothetical protein H072_7637 [Dactylellina haptotyla CBS 200.50]|uniref:WSC domain-containing protein n=1 Tax=Dactylellina haptotyla (strain CBS 200.50) TaxID=1284197 RepID=S8ABY9_DACHA|nr:hypothetical protein H072_7637 [Dactylellina haptotyla CBS 200.50]
MRFTAFLQLVALSHWVGCLNAQSAECATVANGCDGGSNNQAGISSAIARFQDGLVYGGGYEPIIMSSALQGSNLAMITYLCNDGSSPPQLEGSVIRSNIQKILSCPNQCGGVSVDGNCGFGVLVASNAANIDCFSKAVNVVPKGAAPSWVPAVGSYKNPVCLFDSPGARVLTDGSATADDMTVEKCADLAAADGYAYFGVEFGVECYWGDVETNPQQSAQDNCNQACAGNPGEICGAGNRILLYRNSNSDSLNTAKISVDSYNGNPTSTSLAHAARSAIDQALNDAWDFFNQITNAFVKTAAEQLVQDLTEASTLAAAAASAAAAAALADAIAKAIASEQAVQEAKNQKPTQTITEGPTSTPTETSTSTSSSSSSACPLCVSCADDRLPEIGDDDGRVDVFNDPSDFEDPPTKRQLEDKLDKRTNAFKEIMVCSKSYSSRAYSTGTNNNQYYTYGYKYRVSTQSTCVWNFNFLAWDPTAGGSPPATEAGSYDAEHAYEAQMISQFVEYVGTELDTTTKPCRPAGLIMLYLARTTPFPGRGTLPFSGGSALAELMLNLPSDATGDMVALDKNLNILKAAVFNSATNSFSTSNQAPGALAKVTRFAMLRQYLATPKVTNIFKTTSGRMRTTLRKLDVEIATLSPGSRPGFSFEDKYSTWEDNFLFSQGALVEENMDFGVNSAINKLRTDTSLGSPQLRSTFVTQVQQRTAPGSQAYPGDWFDLDDLLRP